MDHPEKLRRKAVLRALREQKREAIRASFPISIDLMKSLFEYVDSALESENCDQSLRFTEKFLKDHQFPVEPTMDWMRTSGGYCDCDVLTNAWEKFDEATAGS